MKRRKLTSKPSLYERMWSDSIWNLSVVNTKRLEIFLVVIAMEDKYVLNHTETIEFIRVTSHKFYF